MSWTPDRAAMIGERLAARARRSVHQHQEFHTVRREALAWIEAGLGARQAMLHEAAVAMVTLVRLEQGAALPWPQGVTAQEILVVEGRLAAVPADGAALTLDAWGFAIRASAQAGALIAVDGQALVYVRQMRVDPARLPEPEASWWRTPRRGLEIVPVGARRWRTNSPGVEVLPLWGNPAITSMLVRMAAGAGVPDHHHAAHEDCLMLDGEMFLGDILLRPMDYQFAPAGGGHFGEMSDVGGTFFFHGAIDPVLVPQR